MKFVAKYFNELSAMELYEILKSRAEIFVVEQGMNCLDPDGIDYKALHIFFEDNGTVTAYLRAYLKDNEPGTVKIGRVLTLRHGEGIGRAIMEKATEEIKSKFCPNKIYLESQKHAVGFYEKLGFKVISEEFMEEGIPHLAMEKSFKIC